MTRGEEEAGEPTDQMIADTPRDSITMKDKYYMTYFLFYCMGTLTLVPANFFTTATEYWMYKFRDPNQSNYSSDNRTELQAQFTSDYSIVSNVSNVVFIVLTIILLKKITIVKRILGALCGVLLTFVLTVMFVQVNTDSWQTGFFIVTLTIGFFLTAFCSVFMATLFQLVSKFPHGYLPIIFNGQSICGIFSALVQIFTLSIGASSKTNGLVYFLIGMVFVFLALVYFIATLRKSDFFRYYLNSEVQQQKTNITKAAFWAVLKKIKYYLISMIIVLGCSVMINPGVTSLVISVDKGNGNKWNDVFYVAVTTFLFYNVFDYIGREVAGVLKKPTSGLIILLASICRIAFVPMLMLCNAQPRHHLPVVFTDWTYIIFIIIFAFSNGFLVNLCIIQIPLVTKPEDRVIAVILIFVIMITSLGACSFISAALVKAL